jgi:hypothetical protein
VGLWEIAANYRYSGDSANSESSVVLRAPLAAGLPFRLLLIRDSRCFCPISQGPMRLLEPSNLSATATQPDIAVLLRRTALSDWLPYIDALPRILRLGPKSR